MGASAAEEKFHETVSYCVGKVLYWWIGLCKLEFVDHLLNPGPNRKIRGLLIKRFDYAGCVLTGKELSLTLKYKLLQTVLNDYQG